MIALKLLMSVSFAVSVAPFDLALTDRGTTDSDEVENADLTLLSDSLVKALLTVDDLGGDWETEGPEVLEIGPTAEPFSYCPAGDEVMPAVAGASIYFEASSTGPVRSLHAISETVLMFVAPQDIASWFDGIDSCTGEAWGESEDRSAGLERARSTTFL